MKTYIYKLTQIVHYNLSLIHPIVCSELNKHVFSLKHYRVINELCSSFLDFLFAMEAWEKNKVVFTKSR